MAWAARSERRQRLPSNWPVLRRFTLDRDGYLCQATRPDGRICGAIASDVDHIRPGDDHGLANLQSLCSDHHRAKSAQEGVAARRARKARNQAFRRKPEKHPGAIE